MEKTIDGVKKFNKTQKAKERRKRVIIRLEKQLLGPDMLSESSKKRISKEIETLKQRI